MRPDLGRRLAADAEATLASHAGRYDVVFVIADGLSARAVQAHARPVLDRVIEALRAKGWRIAPLVVVRHGRVAIGDAIATALGADCVAILIGERPGFSAADSMGASSDLQAARGHDRRGPQLHLQYPSRGASLRRCRIQDRRDAQRHARRACLRRAAQGRHGPPARQRGVKRVPFDDAVAAAAEKV